MEEVLNEFEKCLNTWIDLPKYVYTPEYKKAFLKFVEKKKKEGFEIDRTIVVMTLHHETGDKMPYFEFNRYMEEVKNFEITEDM